MDGSQLLVTTEFPEARRGYDKAQVDEFLRALGAKLGELKELVRQATGRAEAAEAQVEAAIHERARADLARRDAEAARDETEAALRASEAARAELAEALDDARARLDADEVERATGLLALAQHTAEAAVEEATQRARRLVEDAEVHAAVTRLEDEQRAERVRREVEDEIEALRRDQLDQLDGEVRLLAARRDALDADVTDLHGFVQAERAKLRDGARALARLLDAGGELAPGGLPDRRVGAVGLAHNGVDRPPATEAERRATQIPRLLEGPEGDPDPNAAPGGDAAGTVPSPAAEADTDTDAGVAAEGVGGPAGGGEAVSGEGSVVIDLTVGAGGSPAPEASPLGEPGADAAEAMREFFEADGGGERRILRRRR